MLKRIYPTILIGAFFMLLVGCFPGMSGQRQQVIKTDATFDPAGERIAFVTTQDGDDEIYVMYRDGSNLKKLTDNTNVDAAPSWSPDGQKILFISDRSGEFEIYIMNADGSRQELIPSPIP